MTKARLLRTFPTVIVRLSDRCRLQCAHCYFGRTHKRLGDVSVMTEDKLRTVLAQMDKARIPEVHFEGEHPCINLLFQEVRRAGMRATVSAFGGLFDAGELDGLSDVLRQVNFSVNSWDPVVHDRMRRRPGDHANMLRQVKMCHDNGIDTFHWVAISNDNKADLRRHIEFCSSIGSCGLAFLYVSPFGSAIHHMCVPPLQWLAMCEELNDLRMEYPALRIHFEPIFVGRAEYDPVTMGCKYRTRDFFFINTDGLVYACPLLAAAERCDYALGNICEEEVLNAHPALVSGQDDSVSVSCAAESTEIFDRAYVSELPTGVTKVCWMYWNRARNKQQTL